MKKILDRKSELPALDYIVKKYGLESYETEFTFTDLIEELNGYYVKEKITKIVETAIKDIKNTDGDFLNILDKVNSEFNVARGVITKTSTVEITKDVDRLVEEYVESSKGGQIFKSGFEKLDETVRFRAGQVALVVAFTGMGKTTFMTKWMHNCINFGVPSMFFALEMSSGELTNRLIVLNGDHTFSDLYNGRVSPEDYRKAVEKITTQTTIVTRQSESKVDLKTIERLIVENRPKIIFIDYLSLVEEDLSWNSDVSVTATLKRLAQQYNILIVVAQQASTNDNTGKGDVPEITNIRANRGIAFDMDCVICIASARYETNENALKMKIEVKKARNSGMPQMAYRIEQQTGQWSEVSDEVYL
jgi:replicative DNA helicase